MADKKSITEALESSGQRPARVYSRPMQVRLPEGAKELIDGLAEKQGVTASDVVRRAIAEYLKKES